MDAIYRYLSYRKFLEDWFVHKKSQNPRFSHRAFSLRCKQKSPSFLKDIIAGRRNITAKQEEPVIKILNLDEDETRYFQDLLTVEQSKDRTQQDRAFERIAAARRYHGAQRIEGESYRYLSRWYCPAIRELAHRSDFRIDPDWIRKQLRPVITKTQAQEALQILQDLDMILIHDDGRIENREGSFATPKQVQGLAVHNYHQEMLNLAKDGIGRFSPEERHFLALTVHVPQSLLPDLKTQLNDMATRLFDLCETTKSDPEQVVQVQLHFFPLSKPKDTP
ncbi:MAG: hypothetical protein CL916_07665 [Deltaproteobacteria bacterium]|nr:hypothetical protein [Deltaproteobacteria bacterium]